LDGSGAGREPRGDRPNRIDAQALPAFDQQAFDFLQRAQLIGDKLEFPGDDN